MRVVAAVATAVAVMAVALATAPRPSLAARVAEYLQPARRRQDPPDEPPLLSAGLCWTRSELRMRRLFAAAAGAVVGLMAAQGDLFLSGAGRSAPALAVLGAAAGVMALRVWLSARRDRRQQQLAAEIPLVADGLAMLVLAGESIVGALERSVSLYAGVAAEELALVLEEHATGGELALSLRRAAERTAADEAARLYGLLANAHHSGGRLADALMDLAASARASLVAEMRSQGGRKAVAGYAPILALMVPVTLMFLIYPTLSGLNSLSATP